MTGEQILKAMDNGFTLHGGRFGFWLMSPIDARCTNVHNGAARSLVRRGIIRRVDETQYVKTKAGSIPAYFKICNLSIANYPPNCKSHPVATERPTK
jgi:hypothetical protein